MRPSPAITVLAGWILSYMLVRFETHKSDQKPVMKPILNNSSIIFLWSNDCGIEAGEANRRLLLFFWSGRLTRTVLLSVIISFLYNYRKLLSLCSSRYASLIPTFFHLFCYSTIKHFWLGLFELQVEFLSVYCIL